MSASASKVLALGGFFALGLLPSVAGTWLWTRQSESKKRNLAAQEEAARDWIFSAKAGDLRETLLFQASSHNTEKAAVAAFLDDKLKSVSLEETALEATEKELENRKKNAASQEEKRGAEIEVAKKELIDSFASYEEDLKFLSSEVSEFQAQPEIEQKKAVTKVQRTNLRNSAIALKNRVDALPNSEQWWRDQNEKIRQRFSQKKPDSQ